MSQSESATCHVVLDLEQLACIRSRGRGNSLDMLQHLAHQLLRITCQRSAVSLENQVVPIDSCLHILADTKPQAMIEEVASKCMK